MAEHITVIGVPGDGELGKEARSALESADLVLGAARHLASVGAVGVDLPVSELIDRVGSEPGTVCVLASGDPGFFGIVRPLAERFGSGRLTVHPAPSSLSLAFARLGRSWDGVAVVSAHGRSLAEAARLVACLPEVAVLVSPEAPPEALGRALLDLGAVHTSAAVCRALGTASEAVDVVDLAALARGQWDPLSVVVLSVGTASPGPTLAFGLPEDRYAHRASMITKSEVRAAVLARLRLPPSRGVLWDVGAGSGSVALEAAQLAPWLTVVAVETRPDDAARVRDNARRLGVAIRVVEGAAPIALTALPDPDRVFVGGGGLAVVDAALARLRPGGVVAATFASVDRAAAAADRLGAMAQIAVSRGRRLPDGGWRLEAENPVFLAWGPVP